MVIANRVKSYQFYTNMFYVPPLSKALIIVFSAKFLGVSLESISAVDAADFIFSFSAFSFSFKKIYLQELPKIFDNGGDV